MLKIKNQALLSLKSWIFLALGVTLSAPSCLSRQFFDSQQRGDQEDNIQVPESRLQALLGVAALYPEECTPDGQYCATFSPRNLPILPLLKAISGARTSIFIATYNFNVPELAMALIEALKRGVRVEFLQDFGHVFADPNGKSSQRVWHLLPDHPNLVRYGVPVLRGSNPQMHNKLLLIDDATLYLGSANWTLTGLAGNYENILAIKDPEMLSKFRAEIEELRSTAQTACQLFANPVEKCGTPALSWDLDFHALATQGAFRKESVRDPAGFQVALAEFYLSMHDSYDSSSGQGLDGPALVEKMRIIKNETLERLDKAQTSANGRTVPSPFLCRNFSVQDLSCDCPSVEKSLRAFNIPEASSLADKLQCEKYAAPLASVYGFGVCWRNGLLDDRNQGRLEQIDGCFQNPERFVQLARAIGSKETLVDGRPASRRPRDFRVSFDREHVVAFSPEDRPEALLTDWIDGIAKAAKDSKEAFLYTSTNFVTDQSLTKGLTAVKKNGGRLQVMFDRGRWDDPSFQQRQEYLSELGVYHGGASEPELRDPNPTKSLTVFDNKMIGSYGANHNKMAIGGDGQNVSVTTGSSNWSYTGLHRNDENVFLSRNPWLTTIYAKEILSQLYAYRYGHNSSGPFAGELAYFEKALPCLNASLGKTPTCSQNGVTWTPPSRAHLVMGLRGVPLGPERSVWAYLTTAEGSVSIPAFTHRSFSGNWVTSLPVLRGTDQIRFKFYHAPLDHDPSRGLGDVVWEYEGDDRMAKSPDLALICTHQDATWGQRLDINWCQ